MNQRIKTLPGFNILDGYFCLQRPLSFVLLSLGGERTINENLRQLMFACAPRFERPNCKNPSSWGFLISAWIQLPVRPRFGFQHLSYQIFLAEGDRRVQKTLQDRFFVTTTATLNCTGFTKLFRSNSECSRFFHSSLVDVQFTRGVPALSLSKSQ